MDHTKKFDIPNPEIGATSLSKIFYCWLLPLFKYGYTKEIELEDLYNTEPKDLSEPLGNILEKNWESELIHAKKKKEAPNLYRAIRSIFIKQFVILGLSQFFQTIICRFTQPIILALLLKYFERAVTSDPREGWLLATLLILNIVVSTVLLHYNHVQLLRLGMQCRIASCSLIYRKLLRMNKVSIAQTAEGQIINLLSNDVNRFDWVPPFWHYVWIMPVLVVASVIYMYYSIGIAALIGILALFLQTVPLQGHLSRMKGRLRSKIAKHTDQRVQLVKEIITGIRIIKMYSWEKPFEKIVTSVRNLELGKIRLGCYIWAFVLTIGRLSERLTVFLTFLVYIYFGNPLMGDKVFSTMQSFALLQLHMSLMFPFAVSGYTEGKISLKRIQDFLMLDEASPSSEYLENSQEKCGTVRATNVTANWKPNLIVNTLSNINIVIKPGSLCAIVGPIGAGKSSLLQAVLKELPICNGKLHIAGDISYASQEPWLFGSSVRNNILFGLPYLQSKYTKVVSVCALEKDFELFPSGDNMLVGERGVSLSGGQKTRINLARAIYKDADIYLLDDPLSSVDIQVSKHLFEKCLMGYLKNKTRILVTHQVQFLMNVDQLVMMNNGQIEKIGSYSEFTSQELEHARLKNDKVLQKEAEKGRSSDDQTEFDALDLTKNLASTDNENEPQETQELMEKGVIPTSLYIKYFRNGNGNCLLLFTGIIIIVTQLSSNALDIWLTYWTNSEEIYNKSNMTLSTAPINSYLFNGTTQEASTSINNDLTQNASTLNNTTYNVLEYNRANYIYVYGALLVASVILYIVRSIAIYRICLNASRKLHNKMFRNVLKATTRFFDSNSSGRILNRFSKDTGMMDEYLPVCLFESIQIISIMLGVLILVFIIRPLMIIPATFLLILFFMIRNIYLATAQNIKRIEGLTKAPVLSHVSASIDGLTIIRVSHAQTMITKEFDSLQDQHTSSFSLSLQTSEAFGFYLDLITVVFTATIICQFLIFNIGQSWGASIGLAITQSMYLAGMLQHGMRQTAEVSNSMTSVERIMQYTCLEEETPFESSSNKKPEREWPQFGRIEFKNLTLRYAANQLPILKRLNFEIAAGSKVGIVGRTGAGKSSVAAALLRLAPTEGSIIIDGVDVNEIGLNDLRNKISIIPQEPLLFTASVRYNLDPSEKYEDSVLWQVLEDVELKEHIDDLDQEVTEKGSNFSVGQRQLLCLARAIIRNNKILVMDEATANVDLQTDQLIQAAIRRKFKDCTVLTIAHRLHTVMDSDKILVIEAGEVVEYGHAFKLLQNKEGYFCKMMDKAGHRLEDELRKIAEEDYKAREQSII